MQIVPNLTLSDLSSSSMPQGARDGECVGLQILWDHTSQHPSPMVYVGQHWFWSWGTNYPPPSSKTRRTLHLICKRRTESCILTSLLSVSKDFQIRISGLSSLLCSRQAWGAVNCGINIWQIFKMLDHAVWTPFLLGIWDQRWPKVTSGVPKWLVFIW